MKRLLEQAPLLRVKAPPLEGIFLKKMPPTESVLSVKILKSLK